MGLDHENEESNLEIENRELFDFETEV